MSKFAAFFHWLKQFVSLSSAASVYTAAGMCVGGALGYHALLSDRSPYTAFLFGYCLPFFPLYLVFSSTRLLEWRLKRLLRLKESGLIQAKEHDELRKMALRWYGERLFGRAAPPPP